MSSSRRWASSRHVLGSLEIEHRHSRRSENRSLVRRRHVAARPVLGAADRAAGGVEHDDESGQVLVLAAETIIRPRPQARAAREDLARVHLQHGRPVDRRVGGHRVQERDVVDAGGEVREQVADHLAALAVGLEFPLRPDDAAFVLLATPAERLHGDRLAVEIVELRLVVERVDLARAAVHEQEDDALGLRSEVRRLRRERVRRSRGDIGSPRGLAEEAVAGEQVGQAQRGEPRAGLPEEFAAGAAAEARSSADPTWRDSDSPHRTWGEREGDLPQSAINRCTGIRSDSGPPGRTLAGRRPA